MSNRSAKRPGVKPGPAPAGKDIKAKLLKQANELAPVLDPKPAPKPKAKD